MKCAKCGHNVSSAQLNVVTDVVKNEPVSFEFLAPKCEACGHVVVLGKRLTAYARASSDAYRVKHGLLTTEQLLIAKKKLGMSWPRFAEHTNVSLVTLKRWLRGDIQTKAMDELVRLKTDPERLELEFEQLMAMMTETTLSSPPASAAVEIRRRHDQRGAYLNRRIARQIGRAPHAKWPPKTVAA